MSTPTPDIAELFRTRKLFAGLKRDTMRLIDTYSKYPHAEKLKALASLEKGFRQDALDLGVKIQDVEAAQKKLFPKASGDRV